MPPEGGPVRLGTLPYRETRIASERRLRAGLVVSILILLAAPSVAQESPRILPTRDAAVTYQVQDERGRTAKIHVAWSAALHALRAEMRSGDTSVALGGLPLPPGTRLVLDLRTKRAFAAEDRTGITVNLPRMAEEARRGERAIAQARFRHIGAGRVAGVPCTEWRLEPAASFAASRGRSVRVCLTPDGVPLRAQEEGRMARAEAIAIAYGHQDAARFAPPPGGLAGEARGMIGRALEGMMGGSGAAAGTLDAVRGLLSPRP